MKRSTRTHSFLLVCPLFSEYHLLVSDLLSPPVTYVSARHPESHPRIALLSPPLLQVNRNIRRPRKKM